MNSQNWVHYLDDLLCMESAKSLQENLLYPASYYFKELGEIVRLQPNDRLIKCAAICTILGARNIGC